MFTFLKRKKRATAETAPEKRYAIYTARGVMVYETDDQEDAAKAMFWFRGNLVDREEF